MSERCVRCLRPGTVVELIGLPGDKEMGIEPMTYEFRLCRWHKAADTRRENRLLSERLAYETALQKGRI